MHTQVIYQITTRHILSDTRIYEKYVKSLRQRFDCVYVGINVPAIWEEKEFVPKKSTFGIFIFLFTRKPGIVHFHDPDFLIWGLILKFFTSHKLIYDVHEDYPKDMLVKIWLPIWKRKIFSMLVSLFEFLFAKFGDGIVCATEQIEERFKKYGCGTVTIKNYPIVNPLTKKTWENKEGCCYVGSLSKNRGIFTLLDLASNNSSITIAGTFTDIELESKVKKNSNWKNIDYWGQVSSSGRDQIMDNSCIGLILIKPIPTFDEALPVKLFEYMERGLAVLCTNLNVASKIVNETKCGFVCEFNNINHIKKTLDEMLQNKALCERLGRNGRNAVVEKFNWSNEFEKLVNFYEICAG